MSLPRLRGLSSHSVRAELHPPVKSQQEAPRRGRKENRDYSGGAFRRVSAPGKKRSRPFILSRDSRFVPPAGTLLTRLKMTWIRECGRVGSGMRMCGPSRVIRDETLLFPTAASEGMRRFETVQCENDRPSRGKVIFFTRFAADGRELC
ncbi:Hypothetical protein NTJ_10105 [Nesidiocoris tenuis]|uniref:Uncharacterized protein n=1 Tax=Nesidiocoris tenuis TaxID=355587 RepID=A0ABN7B2B1_9HEMI|nr:Hypothetical protein NTJ_10105 [Nesidiocoris tenuis]